MEKTMVEVIFLLVVLLLISGHSVLCENADNGGYEYVETQ